MSGVKNQYAMSVRVWDPGAPLTWDGRPPAFEQPEARRKDHESHDEGTQRWRAIHQLFIRLPIAGEGQNAEGRNPV
jgi:hypothetical protein